MLNKILMAAALVAPSLAFGQATANRGGELERGSQCHYYDYDAQGCEAQAYCNYDYIDRTCNDRDDGFPGGGGGSRACSSYDRDPYLCNQQPNCQYDNWSRSCQDTWNPGPGPGRRECWDYNNNPRLCDATPGCTYDRRSYQCVDDFGPGPGPGPGGRPVTQTIHCASGQNRYNTCPVYGQLISAYVINQVSAARCVEGQSWGRTYDGIWVDRGCRANFSVTYYPNY